MSKAGYEKLSTEPGEHYGRAGGPAPPPGLGSAPAESLELDTAPPEPPGTSSMRMAFMNMANSILGAGIIGQPLAVRNAGLLGGVLVMVSLTAVIDWTLRLIVANAHLSRTTSYQDTVAHCFGSGGRMLLLATISSFAYGGCMAFCVIIGDTIPHVLTSVLPAAWTAPGTAGAWLLGRNTVIVVFTSCISYPLSLNRDISKLAKASAFALVGMAVIVAITLVRAPAADASLKAPLTASDRWVSAGLFQGISVISFALVCHHNTLFIYRSMRDNTPASFARLTHWACGVSMCFCLLMGVAGFVSFGANTKGNILNNFRSDDAWVNVARFCFGLNMLTTFPLEIFVVRDVLKDLVLRADAAASTAHLDLSARQHFAITTLLVFSSMGVSLLTCNLGMILELIGATSASLMAYILPPLCYLKLTWDALDYRTAGRKEKRDFLLRKAVPCVLCTLFGFSVMVISSYMTIRNSLKNTSDSHCVSN